MCSLGNLQTREAEKEVDKQETPAQTVAAECGDRLSFLRSGA